MDATHCSSLSCHCHSSDVVCQRGWMSEHLIKINHALIIAGRLLPGHIRQKLHGQKSKRLNFESKVHLMPAGLTLVDRLFLPYNVDCFNTRRQEIESEKRGTEDACCRSRCLVSVMKSPGASSTAPIITCDQITPE